MGEKDKAKSLMEKAGLPVVPGYHGNNQEEDYLKNKADKIGYPLLIKARAGGGGRGMRVALSKKTFSSSFKEATSEAKANFNDKNCILEKYISKARHIEIQIFADKYGNVIHLFDRDCSIQRRQQKVIEEAPSPQLSDEIRSFLGALSVKAAKFIQYEGAGTIEFVADVEKGLDKNKIYFIEMNTRIQVEHPVTEAVTSTNLISWQLEIANGSKLPKSQNDVKLNGWSIEARLYAENVNNNFLPQSGIIHHLNFPSLSKHKNCTLETGIKDGDYISPFYDPMIAKIISHGVNRADAIVKLNNYLSEFEIAGITTNLNLLKTILNHKDFKKENFTTKFIEENVNDLIDNNIDNYLKALTSLIVFKNLNVFPTDNWYMWKPNEYPLNISIKGVEERFSIACLNFDTFEIKFGNFKYTCTSTIFTKTSIEANVNGKYLSIKYNLFVDKFTNNKIFTFFTKNNTYEVLFSNILISGDDEDKNLDDVISAPMHGIIKYNNLKPNIKVKKGDVLLSLEAMKMEYSLKSPRDGIIEKILIKDGQQVTEKMKLLILKK
jgi:3-methylcrotonyl-CoA carboxylase alpha subunit